MDYLVYVAHDAENLQFHLWLLDYTKRFDALPEAEKCLSPVFKAEEGRNVLRCNAVSKVSKKILQDLNMKDMTDFYYDNLERPAACHLHNSSSSLDTVGQDTIVADASTHIGLKWQSCAFAARSSSCSSTMMADPVPAVSSQPFRQEIAQIIAHYITVYGPRELNLSHQDRIHVLHALQHTTHPSAFEPIRTLTNMSLRAQSHPNFVRWSICNGNQPRVFVLRTVALGWLVAGTVMAVALVLSGRSRWWRIFVAPVWYLAIVMLIAAYQGLCVILMSRHVREIHPWELITGPIPLLLQRSVPEPSLDSSPPHTPRTVDTPFEYSSSLQQQLDLESGTGLAPSFTCDKLAPLGGSNAYGQEAWVQRWLHTSIWRKLTLKKLPAHDRSLHALQDRLIRQARLWAFMIAIPAVVVLVALPSPNLY